MLFWMLILTGYLLGSFPTAVLVSKLAAGIDIRQHGDKNPGATNIFRIMGERWGIVVLLLDMLKGILAVFLPFLFSLNPSGFYSFTLMQLAAGMAAVCGHLFPVWTGFRGGKAVATIMGMVIALQPLLALSFGFVFLLLFMLFESSNN
jgi:glycerol-3-phosphate acyltransferase PlsY